jgi:Bacterial pre-peptidase C-terminal domain
MKSIVRAAAPLAASLLFAVSAHAQYEIRPIEIGQSLTGQLDERGEPVLDRGRFQVYQFAASQGDRVVVAAQSDDFDTYLRVGRSVGPVFDEMETDDDGGEGTNSRLRFVAPQDGWYLVLVQAFSEEGLGGYTLSLEPAPPPTTGGARAMLMGDSASGQLAETDNIDDEEDRYFDAYTFMGRAGQRIVVEMASEDFDTYLDLGRMQDGEWESLDTDDDGSEEGTNSLLRFTLPEDGEYVIRATAFSEGEGAYTLSLRERPAPVARAPRPITAGQDAEGSLDDEDEVLETDGSYYELWTYRGRAGEQVRLMMNSDDFDTYVAIGRMRGGEFEEIATMDDGGEGTNTLLELTLPEDGEYVIRANAYRADMTGDYTLRVESSRDR